MSQTSKPEFLCLYHADCPDGFGAAWAVHAFYGEAVECVPVIHGKPPPSVSGRSVVVVDFCYPPDVMRQMAEEAKSILVLDHHISAVKAFKGVSIDGCDLVFDMERSGAGMAWDHFFPKLERPPLINHIEDRDLWRWALPDSPAVSAALSSYPMSFDVWDDLMDADRYPSLVREGVPILRSNKVLLDRMLKVGTRKLQVAGHRVPGVNLPNYLTSDGGAQLAVDAPFAVIYRDVADGRAFSLRSRSPDGEDVSSIAALYGGGGHRNAAGFFIPYSKLMPDGSPPEPVA